MDRFAESQLDDPILWKVYRYWRSLAGTAGVRRSAIDPVDMPRDTLAHVGLIEVLRQPDGTRRYRYRLLGSAIAAAVGRDLSRHCLEPSLPQIDGYRDYVIGLYETVVTRGQPVYASDTFVRFDIAMQPELATRRLLMPLLGDGDAVVQVLGAQTFQTIAGLGFKPFIDIDAVRHGPAGVVVPD